MCFCLIKWHLKVKAFIEALHKEEFCVVLGRLHEFNLAPGIPNVGIHVQALIHEFLHLLSNLFKGAFVPHVECP